MLKNPKPGFEEVIKLHFKRDCGFTGSLLVAFLVY